MLEIEMLYSVIWSLTVTSFAGKQIGFCYFFYKMRTLKPRTIEKLPRVKGQFSKRAETRTEIFLTQSSVISVLPHSPPKPNVQFLTL